jgi:hypothetical protein
MRHPALLLSLLLLSSLAAAQAPLPDVQRDPEQDDPQSESPSSPVEPYGELSEQDDPRAFGAPPPERPRASTPAGENAGRASEAPAGEPIRTSPPPRDPKEQIGAVVSPAVLPGGGSSMWVSVGAPELAVGFRQGFGALELGATARADYLRVGLTGELNARLLALEERWLKLVPNLAVGLTGDTGATYYDEDNVSAFSLRVHPGLLATASIFDLFDLLFAFDVPMDFGFRGDHQRYKLLAGVGGELYVGNDISLMLMVQGGGEGFRNQDTGAMAWRPTVQARFGIGFRLF